MYHFFHIPDINECDTDNGGCDQTCLDSIGSYNCSCDIGYILATDNHGCDEKIQTSVVNDTVSDEQENNTVIISSVASVIVLIMMIIAVASVIIVLVLKKKKMMFRRNRSAEVDNSGLEGRKSETLSNQYEGFETIGVDCTITNFTNPIYQVVEQPKLQSSNDDDNTLKKNPIFNMPLDHYSYIDNTAHPEVIFQLPVAAKKRDKLL